MSGYKQREKIGHALKARGAAILTALNEFNGQAKILRRSTLTWADLIDALYIGELDLWKDCRSDIRLHDWAKPEHRQATALYFKILRAKEEIVRLNVEIRRQVTFMLDEYDDYNKAVMTVQVSDPLLAKEIQRQCDGQQAYNALIMDSFVALRQLSGFTGNLTRGQHINRRSSTAVEVPDWYDESDIVGGNEDGSDDSDEDDLVIQFMDKL